MLAAAERRSEAELGKALDNLRTKLTDATFAANNTSSQEARSVAAALQQASTEILPQLSAALAALHASTG